MAKLEDVRIYSIGALGKRQAAQRSDGTWFMRERWQTPFGKRWTRWRAVAARPEHAWYDPAAGYCRLPTLGESND